MAAPNNAYNGRSLKDQKDNIIIHHQEANITDSIATLKERFYLDDVFINEKDSVSGFIGCCYAGTFNYSMHANNRVGSLAKFRETVSGNGNWQSYKLFNDGGLNTKGFAELPLVVSDQNGNLIVKSPLLKSAFYVNSDFAGVQIATNTAFTEGYDWSERPIAQNTTVTDFGISTGTDYGIGTTLYYRAYVKNAEGDYYSAIQSFITKALILILRYSRTSATEALTKPFNNYLADSNRITIGTRIYEDNATHTLIRPVSLGYYDDGVYTYKVDDNGYVIAVVGTGETFPGEGGGGAPEYTTWTCWSGGSEFTAYRNFQLQKSPTNYKLYPAPVGSTSGRKILQGAGDGYYAHVNGDSCYVHEVINQEVIEPAAVYPAS